MVILFFALVLHHMPKTLLHGFKITCFNEKKNIFYTVKTSLKNELLCHDGKIRSRLVYNHNSYYIKNFDNF